MGSIIIKADTLGSLEALVKILRDKNIPIRKGTIGSITKKDISDAESNFDADPLHSILLGFNIPEVASTEKVKIITKDIIYALVDEYEVWQKKQEEIIEKRELENIVRPSKIELLKNSTFRANNPCIMGAEVITGVVRAGTRLINKEGRFICELKSMQADKENLSAANKGRQFAASFSDVTAGRQINEGDILFADINEEDFKRLKKLTKYLNSDEVNVLKEIAIIRRKNNPVWGV